MPMTEEPKKTRLLSASKEKIESVISPWNFDQFRTPEEEEANQKEAEAQAIEQVRLQQEEEAQLRQQAREEGYAEGHQKGYEEGLAKGIEEGQKKQEALLQQTAQQMDELMQSFVEPYAHLENVVFEQMAALSLAVSEKIVQQTIEQTPEWTISVFKKTLAQLPEITEAIEVYIHPELEATLTPYLEQESEHFPQGWRLIAEKTLPKGSVKIKHQNSTLISDWPQQLKTVVDQVWQNAIASSQADSES